MRLCAGNSHHSILLSALFVFSEFENAFSVRHTVLGMSRMRNGLIRQWIAALLKSWYQGRLGVIRILSSVACVQHLHLHPQPQMEYLEDHEHSIDISVAPKMFPPLLHDVHHEVSELLRREAVDFVQQVPVVVP
jgi:hypothetical protein